MVFQNFTRLTFFIRQYGRVFHRGEYIRTARRTWRCIVGRSSLWIPDVAASAFERDLPSGRPGWAPLGISIEQSTRIHRSGSKLLRSKMSPEPPVPGRGISFGRCGMTGRHGCAGLGHPLRFRYRQAVYQAGSPAWSPYGMAMGHSPPPFPSSLCTLPSALIFLSYKSDVSRPLGPSLPSYHPPNPIHAGKMPNNDLLFPVGKEFFCSLQKKFPIPTF